LDTHNTRKISKDVNGKGEGAERSRLSPTSRRMVLPSIVTSGSRLNEMGLETREEWWTLKCSVGGCCCSFGTQEIHKEK